MDHPYRDFENTPAWKAIATAIAELENNQDLHLTTHRIYVIGHLCQQLAAKGLFAGTSILKD
jgi:hypothetical protein